MRLSLAPLALAGALSAQSTPLVLTGDTIPGVGNVLDVRDVVVNDAGDWIAIVRTDFPSPAADEVVLRNGAVFLREGDPLPAPPGATADWIGNATLNDLGDTSWILGTGLGTAPAGVYFDTTPVVLWNDVSTAAAFSPGTPYINLYGTSMNDARQILASVAVDDPSILGILDRALVRLQVDATGALLSETVLIKEGDVLSGTTSTLVAIPDSGNSLAMNDAADAIYWAQTSTGDAMVLNTAPLAVTGGISPVFGSTWISFVRAPVDVGGGGDVVFTGLISNSPVGDMIMTWNGIKFVQEGDSLDVIKPFALRQAGSLELNRAPVFMTDGAQIFWYGEWDDPDTTRDSGFFRDHTLIVQEGVSLAAGQRLDTFGEPGFDFHASDDGRFLIFVAALEDGREGAFLLDLEWGVTSYAGCTTNLAVLESPSSPVLGGGIIFFLYNGQAAGASGFVAVSTGPPAGFPPCGIPFGSAGEILVDVAGPNPIAVLGPATWLGIPTLPAVVSAPIPLDLALVGLKLNAQGLFMNGTGTTPAEPLRLSNGLELTIGLP